MYGLFYVSYDYYKWEDLMCVSQFQSLLREHAEGADPKLDVVFNESEDFYGDIEKPHYLIRELRYLEIEEA